MSRLNVIVTQPQDEDGRTLPKCEYHSFEVGSNTLKALFSDAALTMPLSNPVIADGAGRFFDIFVASGGYKIELRDQFNNSIWIQDNYFATIDGTDLANLEADIVSNSEEVTENIASYDCAGSANTYTLTIKGGLTAPAQQRQGTKILFTPNVNNTGASTVDVEGNGVTDLRDADGVSVLPSGFLSTANQYQFELDGSVYKFFTRSGDSNLPNLTQGNIFIGDASDRPIEKVLLDWVTHSESGELTSGSSHEVTGIPANTTKIEVLLMGVSAASATVLDMEIGHGGTPTYLTAAGDYLGSYIIGRGISSAFITANWSTSAEVVAVVAATADKETVQNFLTLEKFNDGTDDTWAMSTSGGYLNTDARTLNSGGTLKGASLVADLSALKFDLFAGTFTAGQIIVKCYCNPDA